MRFIFLILLLVISSGFVFSDAFATVTIIPDSGSGSSTDSCVNTQYGCYIPGIAIVSTGETVIFKNTDTAAHTFTAGDGGDGPTGEFDTSMIMSGGTYQWTPTTFGDIPYFCMVHPWMTGLIRVVSAVEEAEVIPPTISVQSDKSSYEEGDNIKISGKVTNQISGKSVTLVVVSPSGDIVSIAQLSPDSNGNYSTSMLAGGSMNDGGNYEIRVQHESAKSTDTFYFSAVTYPSSAPYGTDVTIPRDTGSPGCENSNSCYSPYRITIDEGETISWYNADAAAHTVSSGTPGNGPTNEFDSSMMMAGKSFSHTFYNSGTYDYFCMVHPWMIGVVSVNESYAPPTSDNSQNNGMKITATANRYSDTIAMTGYTISDINDVTFTVISPSGIQTVAISQVTPYNGEFSTEFKIGQTWSEDGFYSITAMQSVKQNSLYTLSVEVEVINQRVAENTSVTESNLELGTTIPTPTPTPIPIPTGDYLSVITIVPDSGSGSSTDNCVNTQYGCYSPGIAKVKLGGKVIFKNTDSAAHTFSAGTSADGPTGEFDTSMVMAGNSYQWTPDVTGEIPYFCMVHPWMDGLILVGEGTAPIPTPSLPIPSGTNIVIPSGTSSPGCENSNSCYDPRTFIAGKQSTITWFNADSAFHTVTSGNAAKGTDEEFDSGFITSGGSFSHKFTDDGTYNYFCTLHPWMEGKVSITRSGPIISPPTTTPNPTPVPTPTPTPTNPGTISVSVDDSQYSPGELVTVKVSTSKSAIVAISVIGPNQDSVVSRSVSTDSRGSGSLQFKLPESSQNGTYRLDSTATISGSKVSDSTSFSVKSTAVRISIVSLQPTDQQGNVVSSFTKGKLGFAKIVLSSDSSASSLVTINLFDSDLTSLGIGSFKTTLSSGESEMTLSFFIPNDAEFGTGDIYANVFSDWPSQGGVPLTGESSSQVRIQ